jgi:large subunit ribosomal protein L6
VEGPQGRLSLPYRGEVSVAVEGNAVRVKREGETRFHRAYYGTVRALIANMVQGVSRGFEKSLDIEGVGYNAKLDGKKLVLQVGYCHPVVLEIPAGLKVELPRPTSIKIRGADKQMVGEFASRVRKARPPEPYKGKGIRYTGESIIRKVGKTFGSAS